MAQRKGLQRLCAVHTSMYIPTVSWHCLLLRHTISAIILSKSSMCLLHAVDDLGKALSRTLASFFSIGMTKTTLDFMCYCWDAAAYARKKSSGPHRSSLDGPAQLSSSIACTPERYADRMSNIQMERNTCFAQIKRPWVGSQMKCSEMPRCCSNLYLSAGQHCLFLPQAPKRPRFRVPTCPQHFFLNKISCPVEEVCRTKASSATQPSHAGRLVNPQTLRKWRSSVPAGNVLPNGRSASIPNAYRPHLQEVGRVSCAISRPLRTVMDDNKQVFRVCYEYLLATSASIMEAAVSCPAHAGQDRSRERSESSGGRTGDNNSLSFPRPDS